MKKLLFVLIFLNASITVSLKAQPSCTFTYFEITNDVNNLANGNLEFYASAVQPLTFSLTSNSAISPLTFINVDYFSNYNINNLVAGTYNLVVNGSYGCVFDTTFTILDLGLNVSNINSFCNTNNLNDIIISPNGIVFDSFSWNNNGTIGNQTNDLIAGHYFYSLFNLGILVEEGGFLIPANLDFSALVQPADSTELGEIDIEITGGNPPYNYNWSNGDTIQNLQNLYSGFYDLMVTDANNCQLELNFEVEGNIYASLENYDLDFEIYPNPTNANVFINCNCFINNVNVYDAFGKFIFSKQTNSLDFSNFFTGIYFLEIISSNKKLKRKLFVE